MACEKISANAKLFHDDDDDDDGIKLEFSFTPRHATGSIGCHSANSFLSSTLRGARLKMKFPRCDENMSFRLKMLKM